MKILQTNHKWHLRLRIFLLLFALLAVVFFSVFFSFNLFLKNYIRTSSQTQLIAVTNYFSHLTLNDQPADSDILGAIRNGEETGTEKTKPDLSHLLDSKIRSETKVFNLNPSYEITDFDADADRVVIESIAAFFQSEHLSLENAQTVFIKSDPGKYYVSSIKDPLLPETYLVFYVDVTQMYALADLINSALAVIVTMAMVISLIITNLIAGTITGPVQKLSKFAENLGKGDFNPQHFDFKDIEFEELADAMNRSAEKLSAYDKDQRIFFQNVSHELRTPLMSIRCYAEGISCGVMDPRQSCAVIISETDRLSDLVTNLLYISRIDTIKTPDQMQAGDLRETLSMCANSLWAIAEKNGIQFAYGFDKEPVVFMYNEDQLYRAINNLISNALRYASNTVTLGCRQTTEAIEITITDDGPGISAEDLPNIFDRLYKGKDGKNGIGLAIAKAIVTLHGGSIAVQCQPETCFTIRFPLAAAVVPVISAE